MAKIDKDTLIKNRFWLLLGGAGLLVLVCWLVLLISGSSAGDDRKKKFEAALTEIKSKSKLPLKNDQFVKPWRDFGDTFTKQKEGVWKTAWETQEKLYDWPKVIDPDYKEPQYYDDEIRELTRKEFARYLYKKQFEDLAKLVAPVEFNGTVSAGGAFVGRGSGGGVAPAAGVATGFERIMAPTTGTASAGGQPGDSGFIGRKASVGLTSGGGERTLTTVFPENTAPSMEEIWLVQEDFWVKREMLRMIRRVLDKTAKFKSVDIPDSEPKPAKITSRHRFKNANWEITLLIENDKGAPVISKLSTIKNINATRRTQLVANSRTAGPLKFLLKQGATPFALTVSGEPLAWEASTEFKTATPLARIKPTEPFEMEQELEWATSPIRRIDELRTAKNSHRLAFKALTYNAALYKEPPKSETTDTSPDSPRGLGTSTGLVPPVSTPSGTPLADAPPSGPSNLTPNELERNRYILSNEQCRHLPIGMVLVVDQAAINDVLLAVADSPLQVQITQVSLLHVSVPSPAAPDAGDSEPGAPKVPVQPLRPSGTPEPAAKATEDNNLFELTIYGVATLYERFPARPKKEAIEPATPK